MSRFEVKTDYAHIVDGEDEQANECTECLDDAMDQDQQGEAEIPDDPFGLGTVGPDDLLYFQSCAALVQWAMMHPEVSPLSVSSSTLTFYR